MTKKPTKPKPKLSIIRGGREPPSAHSVEGVLQAALESHHKQPYSDIYIVAIKPHTGPHELRADIMHHSRDAVRMLGVLHWALERFVGRYLPPLR